MAVPMIPALILFLVAVSVVGAIVFSLLARKRRAESSNPSEQERLEKMLRD